MTNPHEWHVVQDREGFFIENEYGEDVDGRRWSSFSRATEHLNRIVPDEIAAQSEAAYDRLMETGGGPTLQEQQIAALKFK